MTSGTNADRRKGLSLSVECDCHSYTTYRDILEVAIEPPLKDANALVISKSNCRTFYVDYTVDHVFVISSFVDEHEERKKVDLMHVGVKINFQNYVSQLRVSTYFEGQEDAYTDEPVVDLNIPVNLAERLTIAYF